MKVVSIVGARPQFVKYYPVSEAMDAVGGDALENVLVHTGQHYDYLMSKVFFDEFGIKEPDYHLDVGSGSHAYQTGETLKRVEDVLRAEKPDVVVVFGDTNSTLAGALAAAKLHLPVAHIEAGLRSFNKRMPEETNRVLTDHVSDYLFCPSETAVRNLGREGFQHVVDDGRLVASDYNISGQAGPDGRLVVNAGDVMHDVLLRSLEKADSKSGILDRLEVRPKEYAMLTLHRAENTDDILRFEEVAGFVNRLSGSWDAVLFPMHPRTRNICEKASVRFSSNVHIIEPVGYFELLALLKESGTLMTDSGGMQKEAFWLRVPCITLRDETEWVETVELGWNVLYKDFAGIPQKTDPSPMPYGDGHASERIVRVITQCMAD